MAEAITLQFSLNAPARTVYDAWLSSSEHSAMTASRAMMSRLVGGEFSTWNGTIRGKNLLLLPGKKIVQSWRTADFTDAMADSVLSLQFEETNGTTLVELEHSDIPPGRGLEYRAGWLDFYIKPMQAYFLSKQEDAKGKRANTSVRAVSVKRASTKPSSPRSGSVAQKSSGPRKTKKPTPKKKKKSA